MAACCDTVQLKVFLLVLVLTAAVDSLDEDNYRLESDQLPDDVRFRPPVGNGQLATNVLSDTVYMNGLYNGAEDSSSRARIQAVVAIDVDVIAEFDVRKKFVLDMHHGLFHQNIQTSRVDINVTYFAHRQIPSLLVTRLDISRHVNGNHHIHLLSNEGVLSTDFTWSRPTKVDMINYRSGTVTNTELPNMTPDTLHLYHTDIPSSVLLPADTDSVSFTFIASMSLNQADALQEIRAGMRDSDYLLTSHKQAWETLWDEGRIDVRGNKDLALNITAATYNILCSVPTNGDPNTPFFGVSPGGLSRGGLLVPSRPGGGHNDYAGHVFWDMDTWMMPPILLLHPGMARRMLGSRTRVMEQVKENARESGYRGVKFPWEQAATGIEATPKWAGNMSKFEVHITSDIAYALRQYMYVSDDVTFLMTERGFELAMEIARFWQSRATETAPGRYEILGVMGPDEYHFNINNSVFTNYNAKLSLTLPKYLISKYAITVNASIQGELGDFQTTADGILILYDESLQYHPQYDNFNLSASIKQSDVVLLGYPLMMPMPPAVRRNDLEMYERITNPEGPDTGTWSMHTVGWLELGDEDRALQSFKMMFRNINDPFKVFSENPVTATSNGGCVNFITGAGGLLQAVLFGYGGLRIHDDRLDISPRLLPNTASWGLTGVHYKGVTLDIYVTSADVTITMTGIPYTEKAEVVVEGENARVLQQNENFRFRRRLASLKVSDADPCTPTTPPTEHVPRSEATGLFFAKSGFFFVFLLSIVIRVNL